MNNIKNRFIQYTIYLLISLPVLSLILNEISWLRFGVDLPVGDDWRPYFQKKLGSFELSYIFRPENDTLYTVGKILDSLAFNYLDGNSVAYQFISILSVLGGLLLLQWKLLCLTLKDRLLAASAFSFTLLMLQPDTYWGLQHMAYHQALPLLCILTSLYITLRERWSNRWGIPILMILGSCSGLSYISGSFSILLLSLIFCIASFFIQASERSRLRMSALSLFITGLITTLAQTWVIAIFQKGTHLPDTPMAFPTERDFWLYLMGKVGRSLMLPIHSPLFSFIVASIFIFIILICLFISIKFIIKSNNKSLAEIRTPIIYISIASITFMYLGLVASGRTHYRPLEIKGFLEVFSFGFHRFHFFWVTILWPWLIALLLSNYKKLSVMHIKITRYTLAFIMPLIFVPIILKAGALNHVEYYKGIFVHRTNGFKCLLSEIKKGDKIHCLSLFEASDLSPAIFYGRERRASFTHLLQFPQEESPASSQ